MPPVISVSARDYRLAGPFALNQQTLLDISGIRRIELRKRLGQSVEHTARLQTVCIKARRVRGRIPSANTKQSPRALTGIGKLIPHAEEGHLGPPCHNVRYDAVQQILANGVHRAQVGGHPTSYGTLPPGPGRTLSQQQMCHSRRACSAYM